MVDSINFVTYNILSPNLCSKTHYSRSPPDALEPQLRKERIFAKLAPHTSRDAIIGIQEIPLAWCGDFNEFFEAQGYRFISTYYGNRFNGSMGVAIAFPTEVFTLLHLSVEIPALLASEENQKFFAEKKAAEQAERESIKTKIKSGVANLLSMLPFRPLLEPAANFAALRSGIVKPTRRGKLPQQHVADRHNRAIFLRLTHVDDEEHPFVVGVYHMPCVWWDTHVMTMHAALVVQALQTYADSLPHALLGDFNIKPEDTAYALITTGRIDPENMAQVQQHLYPTWTPSVHPMRSAYAQVGEEPDYTNHTFSGGRAFTGTLDYIFMSPHFTAKHVIETPALAMSTPICPNHEEPSDHILIGATLDLDPDAGQQQDAEAEPLDQGADEGSHL